MRKVRKEALSQQPVSKPLRTVHIVHVGAGLPSIPVMMDELQEYWNILLGRLEPPIDEGIGTLAHLSSAYFARGKEMEALLLRAEREGRVLKNSNHYKFRTGELRSFLEMAKNSYELGSRLVTLQSLEGGDPSL